MNSQPRRSSCLLDDNQAPAEGRKSRESNPEPLSKKRIWISSPFLGCLQETWPATSKAEAASSSTTSA